MNALYRRFDIQEIPLVIDWSVVGSSGIVSGALTMLRSREGILQIISSRDPQAAAFFGFLVPYFDRELIRFPTPPYPCISPSSLTGQISR